MVVLGLFDVYHFVLFVYFMVFDFQIETFIYQVRYSIIVEQKVLQKTKYEVFDMKIEALYDIKNDLYVEGVAKDRMVVDEFNKKLIIDYGGTDNLQFVIGVLSDFFKLDIEKYFERFDYENFLLFNIDSGMESVEISFKY
mgnify:CR=1 FL=1